MTDPQPFDPDGKITYLESGVSAILDIDQVRLLTTGELVVRCGAFFKPGDTLHIGHASRATSVTVIKNEPDIDFSPWSQRVTVECEDRDGLRELLTFKWDGISALEPPIYENGEFGYSMMKKVVRLVYAFEAIRQYIEERMRP